LGYARIPGQIEWELLPVATAQLTPIATFGMNVLTYKTERGRQDRALFAIPVSFVRKRGSDPSRQNKTRPGSKGRGRIFDSDNLSSILHSELIPGNRVIGAIDITSERLLILEHPPQSQIRKKLEPHIPRQRAMKRQPPFI
jgi:hypothetical protein